ncbi:putative MFS family arabinose efflux permease [Actinomycetospora succinea]|uniref:Putative MFS family arabinose efflux permease n=1 Tax=Actinomycetospora succinea TaxID=663603 RepID=A0A4R6VH51_9PSEU|nr:MFS transporter [Actinomycetospora succinea]TDQ62354.1 putative MFS family arabinose efflux permease [Actinomycetospora succinea]
MSVTTGPRRSPAKAVIASWIGTTIEYYDFAIYGLASSLVFAKLFFPTFDPLAGTLIALSTFGVGYVARPLGALIFGHFGDRVGRRTILVITLLMMGGSTFLIGLLPTYASIGIAAPILLVFLRILQGVSVGGEYSGAVLMTVEHSEQSRRGVRGALVNTGTSTGMILSNLVFLAVLTLPEPALLSWGWRIPFLASGVLVVVGFVVRWTLEESPDFVAVKQAGAVRRLPLIEVLRGSGRAVVLVALATISAGMVFTLTTVFSISYGRTALGLPSSTMLAVLLPAAVVLLIAIPIAGRLADRVGVRAVFLVGAAALVVTPFAWFALLDTRSYGLMLLGFVIVFLAYSANYAVFPVYFSQVFPAALRFSGMGIGFTIGTILGNAFAPAVAASLLDATGGWWGIALYMAGGAVISLLAGLALRLPEQPSDAPAAPATTGETRAVPAAGS